MKADSLMRRLDEFLPAAALEALAESLDRDPEPLRRRLREKVAFRRALAEGASDDEAARS